MTKDITAGITFKTVKKKDNVTIQIDESLLSPENNLTPPAGWPKDKPWTEKDAAEVMEAAGLGLSRSDFCDDGTDLQDLKEIIEGGE